jgi:hypothetical protein
VNGPLHWQIATFYQGRAGNDWALTSRSARITITDESNMLSFWAVGIGGVTLPPLRAVVCNFPTNVPSPASVFQTSQFPNPCGDRLMVSTAQSETQIDTSTSRSSSMLGYLIYDLMDQLSPHSFRSYSFRAFVGVGGQLRCRANYSAQYSDAQSVLCVTLNALSRTETRLNT